MRPYPLLLFLISGLTFLYGVEFSDQDKVVEIEKRLKLHIDHDRDRCNKTPWAEQYSQLHKSLLISQSGKRLVAIPHLSGAYIIYVYLSLMYDLKLLFYLSRNGGSSCRTCHHSPYSDING